MTEYLVEWQITIDATSPEAAARDAMSLMRDPTGGCTLFYVREQESVPSGVIHKYSRLIDAEEVL